MSEGLRPPIFLFGNTRTGTTIIQKLLALHPEVATWYEPRTLWLYPDPTRPHDEFDASDATDDVKRYIRRRFLRYQHDHDGGRIMEKTPANVLKIAYVDAIFPESTILYIVRDPFSVISSSELKWQKILSTKGVLRRLRSTPVEHLPLYFLQLLRQQYDKRVLNKKYVSVWGPRYDGIEEDLRQGDILTVIARQWARCSQKAEEDLARIAPERVLRLRYESFVARPAEQVELICRHAGLEFTTAMGNAANEWVTADRQDKWRRLDPVALAHLVPGLKPEMDRLGYQVPPEIAALVPGQRPPAVTHVSGAVEPRAS